MPTGLDWTDEIQISDTSLPSDPSLPDDISSWGSQDIAIATFLMLLWRDMYPAREPPKDEEEPNEWDKWGRPPAGFVDLGCVSVLSTPE